MLKDTHFRFNLGFAIFARRCVVVNTWKTFHGANNPMMVACAVLRDDGSIALWNGQNIWKMFLARIAGG